MWLPTGIALMLTAGDLMDPAPPRAHQRDSLVDVARTMRDASLTALPVCDGSERLQGIVTERMLVVRGLASGEDPSGVRVRTVAEPARVSIEADEPIDTAFDLLVAHHVRVLPVLDRGRLVGVLDPDAILRAEPDGLWRIE